MITPYFPPFIVISDDYAEIVDDDDYALPATKDYEIQRESVVLIETIGEGQFGDVHKGVWKDTVSLQYRVNPNKFDTLLK